MERATPTTDEEKAGAGCLDTESLLTARLRRGFGGVMVGEQDQKEQQKVIWKNLANRSCE